MAIYNGRILMRKGSEADFDASKLYAGEWAVSLDEGIVRIGLEAGKVIRMATYEAFEEDMKQIEAILLECQTIEEAVRRINTEINAKVDAVVEYVGQAKTYRDEAKTFRDEAEAFKNQAGEIAGIGIATTEKAGIVKPDGTSITVDADGTIHSVGGSGGTSNYNDLTNKPKINGVELVGDVSTDDLNIDVGTVDYTDLQNKPTINGVEITGNLTSDDLNIKAGDNSVELTQAEYDALPDSKYTDGVTYYITDAGEESITASNVGFDNSVSGLEATTVQGAIDKVNDSLRGLIKSTTISLTTDGNGMATPSVSMSVNDYKIISAFTKTSLIVIPFVANSDKCWRFKVLGADMTNYQNNTADIFILYI